MEREGIAAQELKALPATHERLIVPSARVGNGSSDKPEDGYYGGTSIVTSPSLSSVRFVETMQRSESNFSSTKHSPPLEADQSFGAVSNYSQPSLSSTTASSRRGLLSNIKPKLWRKGFHSEGLGTVDPTISAPNTLTTNRSTQEHHRILDQLGYPDELQRDHDAFSLFGVCLANIGFLQGTLFGIMTSSHMGGSAPFAIGWPIGALLMAILSASLAEFASAFPVCGAMFTWTWKLCRASPGLRRYARFLSWVNGSYLFIGHLFTQVLLAYQFATVLQGTLALYVDYSRSIWRTIAIGWAEICVCGVITSLPISRSPLLWKIVACEIFVAFLVMIISLAASAEGKLPASVVFGEYINHTRFENDHLVYFIHWIMTCIATGQDVAAHLAEETKTPNKAVPLAFFWGVVVSYVLGWVSICVIFACVPEQAQVSAFTPGSILLANMSRGLALVVLILILIAMLFQGVAQLLACSRFAWALARDKAIPFSHYIRRVSKHRIPYVAVWLIIAQALTCLLFVAVGEQIIQTLVLASAGTSIIIAYGMPCIIYLFADASVLEEGGWRWTLRGSSKPIALLASGIAGFMIVLFGFPQNLPLTAITFGWGPITAIVSFLLMVFTWVIYGNSHYAGPIKAILGPQIELPKQSSSSSSQSKFETPSQLVGRTTVVEEGDQSTAWTDATGSEWTEGTATLSYDAGTDSRQTQTASRV